MTSQEARKQVDACERQITDTYSNLQKEARSMGANAARAQSNDTISKTMFPLIISLIGLFLCGALYTVWGTILIIAGIFFAFIANKSAASVQENVETQVKYLNNTLYSNSKI